jgi:TPR repeat protein
VDLYTKALENGRIAAAAKLGELYRQGQAVSLDPAKAPGFYEQGVQAGDASSKLGLAELYAEGVLVPRDIQKATLLYEEVLADGGISAASSLGALYLRGSEVGLDPARAIGYYEQAVQAGDDAAMISLAKVYRDGNAGPKDVSKAANLYQEAYRAGRRSGLASAASVLLTGTTSQQRQAHDLILKGQLEDAPGISSVLANAVLGGVGVPKNPARAIEILKKASAAGDTSAATTLIQLYAQGRGEDVAKNISLARTTLASVANQMPQEQRESEDLFIEGAAAGSVGQYAAFAEKIRALPPVAQTNLVGRLVGANSNTYVYILQSALKATGDYRGELNGVLTGPAIRAFNALCSRRNKAARCRLGPLSRPARDVFLDFMRETNS